MASEREELAQTLYDIGADSVDIGWLREGEGVRDYYRQRADAILASDWLRNRDAEKWDEGQAAGLREVNTMNAIGYATMPRNPYRNGGNTND